MRQNYPILFPILSILSKIIFQFRFRSPPFSLRVSASPREIPFPLLPPPRLRVKSVPVSRFRSFVRLCVKSCFGLLRFLTLISCFPLTCIFQIRVYAEIKKSMSLCEKPESASWWRASCRPEKPPVKISPFSPSAPPRLRVKSVLGPFRPRLRVLASLPPAARSEF